jgi:predicted GIY-YIG superfamily endonuclease
MNIEEQAIQDGFRILLLEVWDDRANGVIVFRAGLYDGGRREERAHYMGSRLELPADKLQQLTRMLLRVAADPHVLAGYGRGWKELVAKIRPDFADSPRILDLRGAAIALHDGLNARSGLADLCMAYGIPYDAPEGPRGSSSLEDLLWAVLHRAAERNLPWDDLFSLPTAALKKADFSQYTFDEQTLAALPDRPGIYIMRDENNAVLYIGKAANLARRLADYFKPAREVPEKIETIRARIRSLEIREVGSELEALLLEHQLIRKHQPEVNVQRQVQEATSRYGQPLVPVVVFTPSTRKNYVELFFFGARGRAIQLHMNLKKPPETSLRNVVGFYTGRAGRLRKSRSVVDWGPAGHEICCRYFARARDHLHWTELHHGMQQPAGRKMLLRIARQALESELPGEFRDA